VGSRDARPVTGRRRAAAFLTAVALSACHAGVRPPTSTTPPRPGASAPSLDGFSGVAVVWRGGRVAWSYGRDLARTPASGLSAETSTFDIGSVGKTFTAAAILVLSSRGSIDLGARITTYLRGVAPSDATITIEQLLTYTSGLPEYLSPDTTRLTRSEALRRIFALRRARAGTFRYSDAGYTMLAAIVEVVSGEPFERFVEQQLLARAGMTRTGWYGSTPPGTILVDGHAGGRDRGPAGTQAPPSWSTLGAGGMVSTAADLARWADALEHERVLNPAATAELFRPRVALRAPGASAAFGWVVGTTPTGIPLDAVGGGTDYGFTSDVRIYPTLGTLTVALSNSDAFTAQLAGERLAGLAGA
jgi:CubicO group peptidase (beta-lactamase class C family)